MARRYLTAILAAAIAASSSPALADAQSARCAEEARDWAASVWHLDSRLKVPLYGALGWLVGRPALFAVIAANAESPRERWMIRNYTSWCEGGYVGDPPRVPPAIVELF
jgi:hypothetical protein